MASLGAARKLPDSVREERAAVDRPSRLAIIALGFAGILPPLAFIAQPADLGVIAAMPVSMALTALLILAPALTGLAAALCDLDWLRDSDRHRGDSEDGQAALRVFVGALAVCYGIAMTALAPGEEASRALIVVALGLGGGWALLLLTILDPAPSPVRQRSAAICDAALISAFLHFGGDLAAPFVPLYLLATFHAGFRRGIVALAVSGTANLAGFAAVVATTPYWREQPLLAGGLIAALLLLPAYLGGMVHEAAAARQAGAAAQAARTRFLMVVSQALRAPLDAIVGGSSRSPVPEPPAMPSARALLSQVSNILDFTAIEAGAFVPATEAFDLHRLVNETLAERRVEAAGKGLRLRTHIDPALPYRLLGWPQQLAQILDYLVARAIEVSAEGAVKLTIDAAAIDERRVRLRLVVRDTGPAIAPSDVEALFDPFASAAAPGGHGAFGLAVVRRLVELMDGNVGIVGGALTITVPLAIDEKAVDGAFDLDRCLVLIASEDSQFASDLAEPLNAWNGDPRWIDSFAFTLDFADPRESHACSVLIVDGRSRKLAALSFAHRAVTGAAPPSFVLFVADASQLDGLMDLADGELDAALPLPLDNRLLANALHALPLWHGGPARPVVVPPPRDALLLAEPPPVFDPMAPAAPASPITPIAVHPRFAAEAPTLDPRAVAALCRLGGGDAFLGEVVDSFRTEAKEIMQLLVRAAASADGAGFARGLHALRSCAGNLGGTRLCDVLLSLREVSASELRGQGSGLVQRLGDELARLDAALVEFLPEREERREA